MSRSRRKTFFGESLEKNSESYGQYLMQLTELSISMFDWQNLPKTVNPRFLELTLFSDGFAVFFKDEDLDAESITGIPEDDETEGAYLALQVSMNGKLNVYREPVYYRAYAVNGYNKTLDNNDSVIIYNNMLHTNSILIAKIFARRLYNLDQIINVNANAQKTPVAIQCDETERLTYLNAFKEIDGNAPVLFATKNVDLSQLKAINMQAPYVADKLYTLKTQYWNEALTYLGISNVSFQKKERMVQDEVIRSQGGTIASRYSRLQSRRDACDRINKMFGLNISCDFREDYRETDDELMIEGETGHEGEVDNLAVDFRTN